MICSKCGATIEGGYRYLTCSNCGRTFDFTLFEDAEEPVAASVVEIVEEAPAEPVVVVNHEINAQVLVEDSDTLETGSNVSLSSDNNDLLQETVGDPQIEPIEESEFEQIAEDNYQEDSVEEVFEEQIATAEELENDNNPIVEQPEVHDEGSIDQLNNRPDIELEKETTVEETVIIDAPKDISAHSFFINDSIQCTEIDVPVTIYEPDDQINRIDVNDENRSEAIHSITTEQLPLNYYVIKDKDKSTLILILKNTTPYSLNYIFENTVFYSNGEVLPHFKVETIDHGYNADYFGPGQVAILSETVVSNIDSFTPRIELFINQFPRQDLKIVAYGMDEKWLYFSIFNQSGWECCPIVTVLSYDGDDLVAAYQGYSVWGSNVGSGEFIKSNIEKGIVRVPKPNVNYDSISVYLSSVVYNIDSLINEDSVRILSLEGSSSPISLINLNNDLFENDYWFDRLCDIDTVKLIGDTLFFQDDLPNHEKRSHKGRITRFRHKLSILN